MTNPSVGYADYCTNAQPKFQEALARTRRQDFSEDEKACIAFDPDYCATSWFYYYERLLKKTLEKHQLDSRKNYLETLEEFSRRFAILELVPYYSAEAGRIGEKLVGNLESAKKAIAAAHQFRERAEKKKPEVLMIVRWNSQDLWRVGKSNSVEKNKSRGGFQEGRVAILNWLKDHPR